MGFRGEPAVLPKPRLFRLYQRARSRLNATFARGSPIVRLMGHQEEGAVTVFLAFIGGYFLGGLTALVVLSLTIAARNGDRNRAPEPHSAHKNDAEATRP